ncbi:MAG: UDP-N-acetylmuramate dehydrogenase [Candidatus Binatia bacterium]
MDELRAALVELLGDRARPDEPLARHTSFRIGGPADVLVTPDTTAELAAIVRLAARHGARLGVLGGGSNVLVGDGGMRGVVVKLGRGFRRLSWVPDADGAMVTAGAAVQLGRLARSAVERGLAGLEFAEGIPGTVGGALFMNAGAYGGELATVVDRVDGVDVAGEVVSLSRAALAFRYRRTALPPGFVVTAVRFRLCRDEPAAVRGRMDAARVRRTASQPQGRPNSGSMFKNPAGDFAGRLIEAGGLKGVRVGGARISERHANFIVNEGGAHAADVKALMDLAQRVVWERGGVWLEPEVRLVGRW